MPSNPAQMIHHWEKVASDVVHVNVGLVTREVIDIMVSGQNWSALPVACSTLNELFTMTSKAEKKLMTTKKRNTLTGMSGGDSASFLLSTRRRPTKMLTDNSFCRA